MKGRAIVAGHLCLDLFPIFENPPDEPQQLFSPGHLFPVESTLFSTGGAVANTGGALQALGIDTRLIGRIGDDGFGVQIRSILESRHPRSSLGLNKVSGEGSSYSIILSAPNFDRIFFHHSGVNDSFSSDDVDSTEYNERDLLHFGYPPAMERIYRDDGAELYRLLSTAKAAGLTTSLDLSFPQPGSRAARADWRAILERVLPFVDLFLPSFDELRFMLEGASPAVEGPERTAEIASLGAWVNDRGCPVCVLKLGAEGLAVRTTTDRERIEGMGRCAPEAPAAWAGKELLEPCFLVEARGTTGAGDVTIAGFLASVLRGLSLEESTLMALAAGAASVEAVESSGGLSDWESLRSRVNAGWDRAPKRNGE